MRALSRFKGLRRAARTPVPGNAATPFSRLGRLFGVAAGTRSIAANRSDIRLVELLVDARPMTIGLGTCMLQRHKIRHGPAPRRLPVVNQDHRREARVARKAGA